MNNIELALNTRIEDLLNIMESANYGLDREITYYKLIRDNISEICKDLNLVNNIHNSRTYNRNIILEVVLGIKEESALDRLYTISNVTIENIKGGK